MKDTSQIVSALRSGPVDAATAEEAAALIERQQTAIDDAAQTIVQAAIPLEALHGDNTLGARWMHPELRAEVVHALAAVRQWVGDHRALARPVKSSAAVGGTARTRLMRSERYGIPAVLIVSVGAIVYTLADSSRASDMLAFLLLTVGLPLVWLSFIVWHTVEGYRQMRSGSNRS